MRVSLPVDPHHKTRGEVATLQWVRQNTDIPVPEVICFDASNQNDIGFEYIIMEKMPGTTLYLRWRKLSMAQKTALVERLAEFQVQLLDASTRNNLRGIGTLELNPEEGETPEFRLPALTPGRIVDHNFFFADHVDYDVPRGPFRSSHDWLATFLDIDIRDHSAVLGETDEDETDDETEQGDADDEVTEDEEHNHERVELEKTDEDAKTDDEELGDSEGEDNDEDEDEDEDEEITQARYGLHYARQFLELLPKVFPSIQREPERTFLRHNDLNLSNILVDDQGNITAVLDWECVSCQPLWISTQFPKLLEGKPREDEPQRGEYGPYLTEFAEYDDADLDFEGVDTLFWEHLMHYEQTQLRKVYMARMKQLRPDWDRDVEDSALKVDFYQAACAVYGWISLRIAEKWLEAVTREEFPRFFDLTWEVEA